MLFSSLVFLFGFLPLFFVGYLALFLPSMRGSAQSGTSANAWRKASHAWLLAWSIGFYAWGEFELVLVMVLSTFVDYACGLAISRRQGRDRRGRAWLVASLCTNLGLLAFFKYANFGIENARSFLTWVGADGLALSGIPEIALPLGISFYTFQSMSYTIDVYRRQVEATSSLLDFACYVTMFPQLVAGPIVRYVDVAAELRQRSLRIEDFASGALRFTVGLAKKVLIANTVAQVADRIFDLPTSEVSTSLAWVGALAYTLQIYFDFSGYSDMAIGLGRMLGFRFPENFNYPYVARSNQDFWRRWHISLSTWFRDYLYIPLGGNRGHPLVVYRNLVLVFLLCGLWHGASWNFVIWGGYHGLFLIVERRGLGRWLEARPRALQHVYALAVAVGGWVLFRAETLEQAGAFYAAMVGLGAGVASAMWLLDPAVLVAAAAGAVFATPVAPLLLRTWQRGHAASTGLARSSFVVSETIVLAATPPLLLTACTAALAAGTHNPFIYFRF